MPALKRPTSDAKIPATASPQIKELLRLAPLDRLEELVHISMRGPYGGPALHGSGFSYVVRSLPPHVRREAQACFTRLLRLLDEHAAIHNRFFALAMREAGEDFSRYKESAERGADRRLRQTAKEAEERRQQLASVVVRRQRVMGRAA
jgi:hypothetical protein